MLELVEFLPLMRELLSKRFGQYVPYWITPAHAGTTHFQGEIFYLSQDHPRSRGNYVMVPMNRILMIVSFTYDLAHQLITDFFKYDFLFYRSLIFIFICQFIRQGYYHFPRLVLSLIFLMCIFTFISRIKRPVIHHVFFMYDNFFLLIRFTRYVARTTDDIGYLSILTIYIRHSDSSKPRRELLRRSLNGVFALSYGEASFLYGSVISICCQYLHFH
ncbi:hypothetical protein HMPREF9013_0986 [Bulleidia extructa W1219]|uniref:Uncharacterized protein n=1 Tax=Bulleidia extructa W1219 TaxID=679192 RepID=D2MMK3_9FIRM|nr:hypothetical protein HMPREF9013_0986 [Bulleidia extructa W1219]